MNPITALGPREQELLALAARPMSAKEIAAETGLSVGTVNNYLSSAQRRLGARNRNEAVRMFRAHTGEDVNNVHMNFYRVPDFAPVKANPVSELMSPDAAPLQGLADSMAPRSRASLEAFLGPATVGYWELPDPGSLDWRKRLCAIFVLTIAIAFLMASVVILLDALTRLTTSI
jgi:DNA-binding CsgD family transcriptional regulator